jgi:hypothetical protein
MASWQRNLESSVEIDATTLWLLVDYVTVQSLISRVGAQWLILDRASCRDGRQTLTEAER